MNSQNLKEAGLARLPLSLGLRLPVALSKVIPYVGTGVSAISAGNRLLQKDYLGSLIDAGAGVADLAMGAGTPVSGALSGINMVRDELTEISDKKEEPQPQQQTLPKTAGNQFKQDIADPSAGMDSDFYSTIAPLITSKNVSNPGAKALQDDVRKGIVGMQYLTGSKKNTGETFYDEHPAQAAITDLLGNSGTIGAVTGGTLALGNVIKQIKNMHRTEPGGMSRDKNEKDPHSPGRLLRESSGRADVTRLFGDLENNPELRLSIYDKLNGGDTSFLQQHRTNKQLKEELAAKHSQRISELQSHIEANPHEVEKINSMMKAHADSHAREIAKLDAANKELFMQAERSPGAAHLDKYVNLHESLRAAREKGGLKAIHGEGHKHLAGVRDLLERRHITGGHGGFNQELIHNILQDHAGTHGMEKEWQRFAKGHLADLADPKFQSSGLRKFMSRMKGPAVTGGLMAAGGYGLHKLLKMMQENNYSEDKINEWKKTLLQSRGDFDRAAKYDKEKQQEQ